MVQAFTLTPTQRAQIDAVRSDDAKTMLLQDFHQDHAYAHRDRSIFGMVADPAAFTRWWNERAYEHTSAAWEAYLGGGKPEDEALARPAESYSPPIGKAA